MEEQMMVDSMEAGALIFGPIFLFAFLIGIVAYVLTSIALMNMARNAGINHAWLSWIPVGNIWIFGELLSDKLGGKGGLKYLLATLIYIVTSFIPVLNVITAIAYLIFAVLLTYWIFEKYSYRPILHTVLSIIIPFYYPIVLMVIRNNVAE